MPQESSRRQLVSPWWKKGVVLTICVGMAVLVYLSVRAYQDAPPIPEVVTSPNGETIFTGADILAGQRIFLRYGLMANGTVWGHGAYLGPDYSAEYLHTLGVDTAEALSREHFQREYATLAESERIIVNSLVTRLKANRYNIKTHALVFSRHEADSFARQQRRWAAYFSTPAASGGLPAGFISDPEEIRQLTAFFAWTAWASVANRPGHPYSHTNNFPYDPLVVNIATARQK